MLQMMSSTPAEGSAGLMETEGAVGGVFKMMMPALTGSPVVVPSLGVTVQTTSSPATTSMAKVELVDTITPLSVHSRVDLSGSPSGSKNPVYKQVSVSPA